MQNIINTLPASLAAAGVKYLTEKTLPKFIQTSIDNKAQLEEQDFKKIVDLLKFSPDLLTETYENIQDAIQKAQATNDKLSLNYIKELLILLKAEGISGEIIDKLINQIVNNEHAIRLERTKGFFLLGKVALLCIGVVATVIVNNSTEKKPFWYK